MTEEQIKQVVADAVKSALAETFPASVTAIVREVLLQIGMGLDSPLDMQKDMAWVRAWRLTITRGAFAAIAAGAGLVATGLLWALWAGIRQYAGSP
jgi:hypothetical protein